ncbi:MAG TPA: hypothetical protein VMG12_20665 [Polyangiaceae bacterium]|nr:hypothetical protein [Polyangiaceae bacterium]
MSAPPATHRGVTSLLAALIAGSVGCALVPGVPAGPIRSPGVRAGLTYAYAYGRASARVTQPSGEPTTVRGNGAMFNGLFPLLPLRAMLRASPAPFVDVGVDWGWTDAALQLRAGPLDAHRRWPWGIELEGRTGRFSPFQTGVRDVRVLRGRAELYPALGRVGQMDGFGVLTLGASRGTSFHQLFVPSEFDEVQEGPIPTAIEVSRVETRLEASLGVHGRVPRAAFTIVLQPWFMLAQGAPRDAACTGCSLVLEQLDAPWGVALLASGSLVWDRD